MNKQREDQIIKILLQQKTATVKELSERLYASMPSIRRDLAILEKAHMIKRTHGGAVLEISNDSELKIPFIIRELEQSDAKIIMAKKAAQLVNNNDVIFIDASTSAYSVIPFLINKTNLTIITCGLKSLQLAGECGITAFSTGGKLIPSCMSLTGAEAYRMIENYTADIMLFSCRGLTDEGNVTDFSLEENWVRRVMLKHSKKKILLCDSSKIGKVYMNTVCSIEDITYVISEKPLPPSINCKEYI